MHKEIIAIILCVVLLVGVVVCLSMKEKYNYTWKGNLDADMKRKIKANNKQNNKNLSTPLSFTRNLGFNSLLSVEDPIWFREHQNINLIPQAYPHFSINRFTLA
jgi:hypothetical protein